MGHEKIILIGIGIPTRWQLFGIRKTMKMCKQPISVGLQYYTHVVVARARYTPLVLLVTKDELLQYIYCIFKL